MNLASQRTHLSSPSFQRGVSWIAAIVATLAFFLVFASFLLASYPIGSAVRGYFYGPSGVPNPPGNENQLYNSEIAIFSGNSSAIGAISDSTEAISGNTTDSVALQTFGIDAIVEGRWRNSSSGSDQVVPESVDLTPSINNPSTDDGTQLICLYHF